MLFLIPTDRTKGMKKKAQEKCELIIKWSSPSVLEQRDGDVGNGCRKNHKSMNFFMVAEWQKQQKQKK